MLPEAAELDSLLVNKRLLIGAAITSSLVEALRCLLPEDARSACAWPPSPRTTTSRCRSASRSGLDAHRLGLGAFVSTSPPMMLLSGNVLGLQAADIGLRALPVALLGGLEACAAPPLAGVLVGVGEALAAPISTRSPAARCRTCSRSC